MLSRYTPFIRHLLNRFQAALLPCQCACCGAPSGNELICSGCKDDLPWLTKACAICSLPLFGQDSPLLLCGECIKSPPPFDHVTTLFSYESPINHLIHQLKFAKKLSIARLMGEFLLQKIINQDKKPDLIIPVPLHSQRLKERGFNQAHEIARYIAKPLGIPLMSHQIVRHKNTVEQASLPFEQRKSNLAHAFSLRQKLQADYIAIVDDVMTTGYTVRALADLLRKNGVKKIAIWCCARTGLG